MASGAPLAATTSRAPPGPRHTCETASSSGESGYSRTSSQVWWRCSVPVRAAAPSRWKARSIGSKGSRWLARMPSSTTSCTASGSRRPSATSTAPASPGAQSRATLMRFSVRVPVLSVQRTVAAPSASTAGSRRVSMRLRESRQAPMAMNTVSTTGSSSGRMAMARATPASSPRSHSPRTRPCSTTSAAHSDSPAAAMTFTAFPTSVCRRVGWLPSPARATPIRPISVRAPVAPTMARPRPRTTSVPA